MIIVALTCEGKKKRASTQGGIRKIASTAAQILKQSMAKHRRPFSSFTGPSSKLPAQRLESYATSFYELSPSFIFSCMLSSFFVLAFLIPGNASPPCLPVARSPGLSRCGFEMLNICFPVNCTQKHHSYKIPIHIYVFSFIFMNVILNAITYEEFGVSYVHIRKLSRDNLLPPLPSS